MKIYTKTGDKGETGFIGGRIAKSSPLMECLGTLDELNSMFGVLRNQKVGAKNHKKLRAIQSALLHIGGCISAIATKPNQALLKELESLVQKLEVDIDTMWAKQPELKGFIVPGGTGEGAQFHLARSLCRRAERSLVTWRNSKELKTLKKDLDYFESLSIPLRLLNRLSDWLFTQARALDGNNEQLWDKTLDF